MIPSVIPQVQYVIRSNIIFMLSDISYFEFVRPQERSVFSTSKHSIPQVKCGFYTKKNTSTK